MTNFDSSVRMNPGAIFVHGDLVLRQGECHRLRQESHGRLRDCVMGEVLIGNLAIDRSDVDDAPFDLLFDHVPAPTSSEQMNGDPRNPQDVIPCVFGNVEKSPEAIEDAHVVHVDIDLPKSIECLGERSRGLRPVRDIGANGEARFPPGAFNSGAPWPLKLLRRCPTATRAPSAANFCEIAPPIPSAPPVTTATLSSSTANWNEPPSLVCHPRAGRHFHCTDELHSADLPNDVASSSAPRHRITGLPLWSFGGALRVGSPRACAPQTKASMGAGASVHSGRRCDGAPFRWPVRDGRNVASPLLRRAR